MFGAGARFFVPIVSASYAERPWPQHEWTIATREAENRQEEFILPLRVDDSLLVGLPDTLGYVDLRRHSVDEVADLLIKKLGGSTVPMARPRGEQTWVAAFGLLIQDLLDSEDLPLEAPSDYATLCDWLTEDLKGRLDRAFLADPRLTEDARNGETFTLRVAFEWGPSKGPLEFGELGWWELLELLPYDQIYDSADKVDGGGTGRSTSSGAEQGGRERNSPTKTGRTSWTPPGAARRHADAPRIAPSVTFSQSE